MTIDHAIAPSQLMAEIAEIDVLLMQYEDWRALLQLESREKQGDAIRSVNGDTLKALLLESLSVNPLFARRQLLLADLEKMARDLQRLGPRSEAPEAAPVLSDTPKPLHDDLTEIVGIDARLAKRLNILNVRSFNQIANWTPDDIAYVANTLGLDQLIAAQDWIGQAAQLGQSRDVAAPAGDAWVHARNGPAKATPAPAVPITAAPNPSMDVPTPVVATKAANVALAAIPVASAGSAALIVEKVTAVAVAALPTEIQAPAKTGLPAPAAVEKVVVGPAVAAVSAGPKASVDDRWKSLVPASPLAARTYKTGTLPIATPQEAAPLAAAQPKKSPLPTMPLAARHYAGAVLEPKRDGAIHEGLVPAKPLPAPAYRVIAPELPVVSVAPAVALPSSPPATQPVAAPAGKNDKAADILQHTLPPLPLRPSAPAVPPPKPQTQIPAQPPSPAQPAASAATSEALLLAVVAARSSLLAGASPPPLPAEAKNGKAATFNQPVSSPPASSGVRPAQVIPAAAPPPMLDDVEPRSRQAAVEARVTIKRAEEALANSVLRTPGGTEFYLGARRGSQPDDIDGASYAAYRGSIEEASVQIVRRPPATKTPDVPPPLTPEVARTAQTAAQAAARAAAQVIQSRPPGADAVDSAPLGGATMGRFLKALTGQ